MTARCPCPPPRPGPQPPGVAGVRWIPRSLWDTALEKAKSDPRYLERFPFQTLAERCHCDPPKNDG
jgi:hypothetical protein